MVKSRIDAPVSSASPGPSSGSDAPVDSARVPKPSVSRPKPTAPRLVTSSAAEAAPARHRTRAEKRTAAASSMAAAWLRRVPDFVEALGEDDESRSCDIAEEAFRETGDPQKVVEILFRPAAHAMGELWLSDETDFLQVTIGVGRMQRLFRHMTRERPPVAVPDARRRVLLAPAPGDQHAFGLSVVEDAFRRAGWDVDRCECDEVGEMFELVGANEYLVIGISVSVSRTRPELVSLARDLRAKSRNRAVVLMAGGRFVVDAAAEAIGAGFDLTASDAISAVAKAQSRLGTELFADVPSLAAE